MSTVSTVIASANLARTEGRAPARAGLLFQDLSVGQNLKLRVLRQLDQNRYDVAIGSRTHRVESRVPLQPGTQFEARVESKGDRLELRYLSLDAPEEDPQASPWLDELARQFRVPLDAGAMATIQRSASESAQPEVIARAGLFLQKVMQRVSAEDLGVLYRALSDDVPVSAPAAGVDFDVLPAGAAAGDALADHLDAATRNLPEGFVPDLDDARAGGDAHDDARRAQCLLNLQDEGSVAWRYGTLPILVGGQLVELDLVMFRERQASPARTGLRRLVMTLQTTHFGRVRVEARAVDSRILVKMQAPTADAIETLSAYGADVRAAIERLGWQVDEVSYDVEAHAARAAQAVIDHVLSTGSVDREL